MFKTMREIEREYSGNWVFMINCKSEYNNTVLRGSHE